VADALSCTSGTIQELEPPAGFKIVGGSLGCRVVRRGTRGHDRAMDLDTVASELYGLRPEVFAAARENRASEARASGDSDLAALIGHLRRPTTSAWLANLLVRERPAEISAVLELGRAMDKAQSDLAGEEMRQLSQQRQRVVASLSDVARQLAHDIGKEVSESTIRELEETLDAAIANSQARDTLASGHLASAMRYSGLGGVELRGVVAKPTKSQARSSAAPKGSLRSAGNAGGKASRRSSRSALARAQPEATEHARKRQAALEEVERCNKAITEVEDLLRSLRSDRKRAQTELLKAERALEAWGQG
jgi:hypothetical protein